MAMSTPMRRTRSACCARAASGQAAAVPPRNVMNSRRLMSDMGFLFPNPKCSVHCYGSHTFRTYIGCEMIATSWALLNRLA